MASRRLPKGDLTRAMQMRRVLGTRRTMWVLAFWHGMRGSYRFARVHPAGMAVTLVLLMAMGLTSQVVGVLAVAAGAGWALLGWERKGKPHWLTYPATPNGWRSALERSWWSGWERNPLGTRACLALAGASTLVLWWLPLLVGEAGAVVAGALLLLWIMHLRVPYSPEAQKWTDERALLAMLRHPRVNVLPAALKGDKRVWLSRKGQPWTDERGEHVRIQISDAVSWEEVAKARRSIAAFYDVDRSQIEVVHEAGTSESLMVLSRLKLQQAVVVKPRLSPLCFAERWDATRGVPVGLDAETGAELVDDNLEANSLRGAAPRSGKTEACRVDLLSYLLDPRALVFGLDGKGSRSDYARVARMAEAWVWGTDDDAAAQLVKLLTKVLDLVQHRNEADVTGTEDWPPVLLMLEELQDVRAGASVEQQEAIDNLLGRIVRMGGAPRVKLLVSTQRTSVNDLPSGVRNLLNHLHAGWISKKADYALVLGESPDVPTDLARKGEWIRKTADGQRRYLSDRVPPAEWQEALGRAEKLRAHRSAQRRVQLTLVPEQRDPLLEQAVVALAVEPLQASRLLGELDEDVRPKDATQLGKDLRAYPEHLSLGSYKGRKCWHLTTMGRTLADTLAAPSPSPSYQGRNDPIGASA